MSAEATRKKRLRMRCWRRGMKEMDLILGPFADAVAAGRAADLDALERLIEESDRDLYAWVSGAAAPPAEHAAALSALREFLDEAGVPGR